MRTTPSGWSFFIFIFVLFTWTGASPGPLFPVEQPWQGEGGDPVPRWDPCLSRQQLKYEPMRITLSVCSPFLLIYLLLIWTGAPSGPLLPAEQPRQAEGGDPIPRWDPRLCWQLLWDQEWQGRTVSGHQQKSLGGEITCSKYSELTIFETVLIKEVS